MEKVKARKETLNSQMMIEMMAWMKATKEEIGNLKKSIN